MFPIKYAITYSAGIHDDMMTLSGLTIKSSVQLVDMRESRKKNVTEYYGKFKEWLHCM